MERNVMGDDAVPFSDPAVKVFYQISSWEVSAFKFSTVLNRKFTRIFLYPIWFLGMKLPEYTYGLITEN